MVGLLGHYTKEVVIEAYICRGCNRWRCEWCNQCESSRIYWIIQLYRSRLLSKCYEYYKTGHGDSVGIRFVLQDTFSTDYELFIW